jgi:hypothetical protein
MALRRKVAQFLVVHYGMKLYKHVQFRRWESEGVTELLS